MTETVALALSPQQRQDLAVKAKARLQELQQVITMDFIEMARVLQTVEDQHLWDVEHDSYWEFLEDCGLTSDQARKMVEVARHVLPAISDDQAKEMGRTKLVRLIPIAKSGKLDEEMVSKAVVLSDRHLRQEMGHALIEPTDQKIKCPQCGFMVPLGFKKVEGKEPAKNQPKATRRTTRPAEEIMPSEDEPVIESEPFTPPPTVKFQPEELRVFEKIVALGMGNDQSTARITKNLIQQHGITKISSLADEAIKSGKGYSGFAISLSGMSVIKPETKLTEKVESYRLTITETLRNKVFKRDGYKCVKCGATEDLTPDHIIPFVKGGPTTYENLQTLCKTCNYKKRGEDSGN